MISIITIYEIFAIENFWNSFRKKYILLKTEEKSTITISPTDYPDENFPTFHLIDRGFTIFQWKATIIGEGEGPLESAEGGKSFSVKRWEDPSCPS